MNTFTNQAILQAIENSIVRSVWSSVQVENMLLRYSLLGSQSYTGNNANIAWSFDGNYIAGRDTTATPYITKYDPADSTTWNINWSSKCLVSANPTSLRGSFGPTGHYYTAEWTWGANPVIYETVNTTGTTYTHTAWSSAAIPITTVNSAALVRRIEAVSYTSMGCVVTVGEYDFGSDFATLSFYLSTATTCRKLDTIIQFPFTDAYSSWYATNPGGSFVSAMDDGSTITVVAYDNHRALMFHLTNGIESGITMPYPIDDLLYYGTTVPSPSFKPVGFVTINGTYYLSCNMTRPFTDGTSEYMEFYLTSEDAWNWSVGEYSSFVSKTQSNGMMATRGNNAYWVGNGNVFVAPLRPIDGIGAPTDISTSVVSVKLSTGESIADQAEMLLLTTNTSIVSLGDLVTIQAGHASGAGNTKYGGVLKKLVVDEKPVPVTISGVDMLNVTLLDLASWRLKTWGSMLDAYRQSRGYIPPKNGLSTETDILQDFTDLIVVSPMRDVTATGTGLTSNSLNDPLIATTSLNDERDGLVRATMRFTNADQYSLTSFGFLFGGDDSGNFNSLVVPMPNSWSGHTQTLPKVMRCANTNLYNWSAHTMSMWESAALDGMTKLLSVPNATATAYDSYFYNATATGVSANVDYQFTMRKSGSKIQLYKHTPSYTYDGMANANATTMMMEYRFNGYARKDFGKRWGLIGNTDVAGSTLWFQQAGYGDIDTSLTTASNYYSTWTTVGECHAENYQSARITISGSIPEDFHIGRQVWLKISNSFGGSSFLATITGLYGGSTYTVSPASVQPNVAQTYHIQYPTIQPKWGEASSSYSANDGTGVGSTDWIINNPGSNRLTMLVGGRGMFINDASNSDAVSMRYVLTDGKTHVLYSGSPAHSDAHADQLGTGLAWDTTSPIVAPNPWSLKLANGLLFSGDATQYGLPVTAKMKVENEVVRYIVTTMDQLGTTSTSPATTTWTVIPTYYGTMRAATGPMTQFYNWVHLVGGNQIAVSDNFGTIPDAVGLLAEIRARQDNTNIQFDDTLLYHVVSTAAIAASAMSYANAPSVTLDNSFAGNISEPQSGLPADLMVLSGRAQNGTTKTIHTPDAAVVYYPDYPSYFNIKKFNMYTGLANTAQDDVKYIASLAGVRGITFRNRSSYSGTPSTVYTMIDSDSIAVSLSDFVIDITAALTSRLRLGFRSAYYLDFEIGQDGLVQAGSTRMGMVKLSLANHTSGITAHADGNKWLERANVSVTDTSLVGIPMNIRVMVMGNNVAIEIEHQNVWTFNLDDYDYTTIGGVLTSNKTVLAGPVTLEHASAITAVISDMSTEVQDHPISLGDDGTTALSFVTTDRHIWSTTTQTGGIRFSKYYTRDDAGTYTANVYTDAQTDSMNYPIGHISASGAEFGEYVDEEWIQLNGYRFGSTSNQLLMTVQDSKEEARLQVRMSKEYSHTAETNMGAKFVPQPGDKITYGYGSPGSALYSANSTWVVTTITYNITESAIDAVLQLRRYYPY